MKNNNFWAKTTIDEKPGISVYDHMLNVGCVAQCIAERSSKLLERFNLRASVVGALAALHDLGKISPGFQRKCEAWLEENCLKKIDRDWTWDTNMDADHGKVSHSAIQSFLLKEGIDRDTAKYVSSVIGAHHGRMMPPDSRGFRPQRLISDSASGINWDDMRNVNAQRIWDHFIGNKTTFEITDSSPALWWLAGLTSVADWIGSDERFFLSERRKREEDVSALAKNALKTIGFQQTEYVPNLSFHDLFHDKEKPEILWMPNEMQEKSFAAISGPGVYVIEAPMGMGKTEAALWAAYKLLVDGNAGGIYFALPTQATSNRMHLRMKEFVQRISSMTSSTTRLIHGNSWLTDQTVGQLPIGGHSFTYDDVRTARDWFVSAKRALIAPFGVGTIDQALLGVVAAKHFFVRHFALAGKVVILDEVHSYDLYTGTLINKLITTLEGLGCTVIILSATLTGKRRGQIVAPLADVSDDIQKNYPLITGRYEGNSFLPVAAIPPDPKTVDIEFISAEDGAKDAVALAQNGGTVLWICDTVDAAQKQFGRFSEIYQANFPIGLLHSRFPYWRREELENEWMERFGKNETKRCGSILISTQVVEQSVDLDADLMITELAPTDMLLQRLGRLWRHQRKHRAVDRARFCIIKEGKSIEEFSVMEPKAIVEALGSKAHVYDPFVLLRTLQLWQMQKYSHIIIPTQIRELIEATYDDEVDDPESWKRLFEERFVRDSNKRFLATMNSNYWQPQLPDTEGVQTRLNDMPTVAVVLCQSFCEQEAVFVDGSSVKLGEVFQIATAQAIHKNLVRVPLYCFDTIKPCPAFKEYIFAGQSVGIVKDMADGMIEIDGLQNGIRLYYSYKLGLVIRKQS